MFFINAFYLDLFCIHVCVDDAIEKKKTVRIKTKRRNKSYNDNYNGNSDNTDNKNQFELSLSSVNSDD